MDANTTMLEAHVSADTTVTIHRAPIPQLPSPDSVLIKIHTAGTNPKDWKVQYTLRSRRPTPLNIPPSNSKPQMPAGTLTTITSCPNSGDDCSGTIAALGSSVRTLHIGQRVAALHQLGAEHGTFAEYCIVKDFAVVPIPDSLPFEAAATIPMAFAVASIALFSPSCLGIAAGTWDTRDALPANHPLRNEPLLIYGASTAVGTMAIKLARICNIHPLICVAGCAKGWVESDLLDTSWGDLCLDYRDGHDAVLQQLQIALKGKPARYAFDAASTAGSYLTLAEVLDGEHGRLALTLPGKAEEELRTAQNSRFRELRVSFAMAGSLWGPLKKRAGQSTAQSNLGIASNGPDFARAQHACLAGLLADGRITPRKYEVVHGGLNGLEKALKGLKEGKNSACSYVVRVGETDGAGGGGG